MLGILQPETLQKSFGRRPYIPEISPFTSKVSIWIFLKIYLFIYLFLAIEILKSLGSANNKATNVCVQYFSSFIYLRAIF